MLRKGVLITVGAMLALGACKTDSPKKSKKSPIIETIAGTEVTTDEFDYVYKKNNSKSEDAYSKGSINEYLELYTNFRLKVKEAESLGYDTTEEFKREFKDYERQLAEPYLTEKSVSEKLVKEAYDRSTEEVNASHLLIRVDPDALPKDTLEAYNKIKKYREMIVDGNGEFSKIAEKFSQDPSAKQNGGKLGYFTALQMVYPFEQAAYTTPVGQVSQPVRTKFGYHIIMVHDKRKARGKVRVAHIMRRATEGMDEVDLKEAEKQINEIYSEVTGGADWESICKQFSEDGSSAARGGELQWFGAGQMPKEFDEAAFSLKEKGEISKPIKTAYGYHIIKLLEKKEIESFEKMKPELESKIQRDTRSQLPKEAFLKRIKKENQFKENKEVKDMVWKLADSTFLSPDWKFDANNEEYKKTLFSIMSNNYSALDFLNQIKDQLRPKQGKNPILAMERGYKAYVEKELIDYERAHLAEKYIDYRMLLQEYRDGILLFKLMDEKVWSKAVQDTAGLRKFHANNRSKYMWGKRADALLINAVDKDVLDKVKEDMKLGKYPTNRVKIAPVLFEDKKTQLESTTQVELDKLVGYMNADKRLTAVINGYTDSNGKESTNMKIGKERADYVKKYITDKGISEDRISAKSFGESKPAAANDTKENIAKNNRVEMEVFTTSPKALEEKYNADKSLTLSITEGLYEKGDNAILDEIEWTKGEKVIEKEGRQILVQIKDIKDPQEKELRECRGLVISDFQNHLEKEWVTALKAKYPVVIFDEEVQKLIKE